RLLMDAAGQKVRFSANVGYMIREGTTFRNLEVKNALTYGAAFDLQLGSPKVHLVPEVTGAAAIGADSLDVEEMPMEANAALKFLPYNGALAIVVGGGAGIIRGFGAPDYRAFGGLEYRSVPSGDPDGDGLIGDADNCPNDAEDKDGFEDTDGCPDTDNDKDGVLDGKDKCPMDAEDIDNFEDADGCPDPDNDGDGLLDAADKCPIEAEDKDGFEDADGCPDTDNDKDGILDAADKCPINAEDIDKFEDEDGCPDPDNDNDGILDTADKCPLLKEVFNGVNDSDGCPDKGGRVKLTCEEIKISEKVYFDSAKAKIKKRSFDLLDEVGSVLKNAKFITLIRVEGHTDDRGRDSYNKELSQKRATSVREYLMGKGIEGARLESVGFGEERPIASNKNRKGRAQNRRVQFVVVSRSGDCVSPSAAPIK
ncbi:MAG: outer membrane protein OmpA-like peptidoglycan-associated protein, partial [Bradymonadia bacterium]